MLGAGGGGGDEPSEAQAPTSAETTNQHHTITGQPPRGGIRWQIYQTTARRSSLFGGTLLVLALIACQAPLLETSEADLRRLEGTVKTRNNGFRTVDIEVFDETSLIVTAQVLSPGQLVHVRQLVDPEGEIVFDAEDWFSPVDEQKSNAAFLASVSSLNWPVSERDPPLVPGRWTALVGLTDSERAFVRDDVRVDVLLKQDADLDAGRLRIVLLHEEDEDPGFAVALDQAKAIWTELYGQIGVAVDFEDWVSSEDDLGAPTAGDPRYVGIAEDVGVRSIVVALSETIDTSSIDIDGALGEIIGLSGGIPGAVVPSQRSAVQVSLLSAACPDGVFSAPEIRLLAETMAHECAHYLGLFHPVEASVGGESWAVYDALDDTPRCGSERECVRKLGENLMFPFPICDAGDTCEPQERLSGLQVGVMHRYVGVR